MFRGNKSLRRSLLWRRNIVNLPSLRESNKLDISQISEVKQREIFLRSLEDAASTSSPKSKVNLQRFHDSGMTKNQLEQVVDAGMMTFLLHVESRIASSLGQGFYTIGPCGEESLSALGLHFKESDSSALHYRHVSLSILRQLKQGRTAAEIILDRARGFTCSTLDPVTGGKHCAIGGTPYDYLVTSTLASQACPAVGRALAIPLSNALRNATEQKSGSGSLPSSIPIKFPKDSISIVSVGEGSTNNAHFLSALNLAEYSAYHKRKVNLLTPVSLTSSPLSAQFSSLFLTMESVSLFLTTAG
jgi:TPP-dependent pyruvate/acetoin dehydrogenase alpha subunit